MKTQIKTYLFFLLAACCMALSACTKMDAYKQFGGGKEVLYTGKPDSLIAYPGKNRIKLSWVRASDPKVTKTRIFWNNHHDSIEIAGAANTTKRVSAVISSLPEGNYNFELYNYDSNGNRSVISRVSGSVYGDTFQKSLLNRAIISFGKQFDPDANTVLNWYGSEAKSVGVEITYQDITGTVKKQTVAPGTITTFLSNYDASVPISYRTLFLPDSMAVDTFYTAPATKAVTNQILIKNSGYPFKPGRVIGRWSDVADWTINDAAKNHNGVGGLDNLNTTTENYMSFEFWGTPAIINGKVYQTGTLAPGNYRLVATISNVNNNLENTYICVNTGTTLPDVANINNAIAKSKVTNGSLNNKDVTLSFTLTQTSMLSLGVVCYMQTVNESSLRIKQFRLFKD